MVNAGSESFGASLLSLHLLPGNLRADLSSAHIPLPHRTAAVGAEPHYLLISEMGSPHPFPNL